MSLDSDIQTYRDKVNQAEENRQKAQTALDKLLEAEQAEKDAQY